MMAGLWKALAATIILGTAACAPAAPQRDIMDATSPQSALRPYYARLSVDLPVAPAGPSLNSDAVIQRIIVGSCIDEEIEAPGLDAMAAEDADLTILMGDNVYGDYSGRFMKFGDADLTELRRSFALLADKPSFQSLRASRPMLAVWDDHDYGANDAGAYFPFKEFAETIHETFWGESAGNAADHPGVYTSTIVGPEGKRIQVILLDTRFFRTDLKTTDEYGKAGKQRYVPTDDPDQSMLGERQWLWLRDQLEQPADLRLLVSSIQITPNVHGWESWSNMPLERDRLYDLLAETGVEEETVFVSGDRHTAFIYENTETRNAAIPELTASSVNKSFSQSEVPNEEDPMQTVPGFAFTNYGVIEVDWASKSGVLKIVDEAGVTQRESQFAFE